MPDKKPQNYWLSTAFKMFAEMTGWIAFPVIGALYFGRWLDNRYDTAPIYFLSITAFAFIISSVGLGITGVKYMKQVDKQADKDKNDTRDRK